MYLTPNIAENQKKVSFRTYHFEDEKTIKIDSKQIDWVNLKNRSNLKKLTKTFSIKG